MQREQWLAERRKGIGSSDAAQICNLSPYGNPLSVYLDKIGQLPPQSSPEMSWGTRLERVIAEAYVEETGRELATPCAQQWHGERVWMGANVDRVAWDRIVELKTSRTSQGWGEPGTDQIPEAYLIQVQHQLSVVAEELADVAVLIGGSDFRIYTVPRSEEIIAYLIRIEGDFWNQVQARVPPPADWNDPRTPELIALLHRPAEGKVVELGAHHQHLADQYQRLGEDLGALGKARDEIKARLIEGMGDASVGMLPDGRVARRKEVNRKAYEVKETSYFDFRISHIKEQR